MIVGIDEVGRGCWAGPVMAGAVILRRPIAGVKDSKQLTKLQRERFDAQIRVEAVAFGVGHADPAEIDTLGMTAAIRLAMERALAQVGSAYREIVIDGAFNFLQDNPKARCLTKADLFIPAVSAASVIAKVTRDKYMAGVAAHFPGYGFDAHVGYGTAVHAAALSSLGPCELHRRSFKPIQALGA